MREDTMSYDAICYKRNFLTEVIARVDLISPIKTFEKQLPSIIMQKIKPLFPIPEPRKLISIPLQVSSNGENAKKGKKKEETMEWLFHGKNKEKALTITPNAVFVQYNSYNNYEQLRDDFLTIISSIFDKYEDAQGQRLGLRYINNIIIKDGNPLEWSEYLDTNLLCSLNFYSGSGITSRAFHSIEYNFDDFNLRYQFGIQNPDYPAPIKKKSFILDFDAYYQGFQNKDEITKNLDIFHAKIQEFFELSITASLRGELNDR